MRYRQTESTDEPVDQRCRWTLSPG